MHSLFPSRPPLTVTVTQHGPAEYSWSLMRGPSCSAPAACVLESGARFSDFEQAMDAGFEALKETHL